MDLVTVATFANVAEAELAKARLAAEGIRAFVLGEHVAALMPYLGSSARVGVQVGAKDAERAREILGS